MQWEGGIVKRWEGAGGRGGMIRVARGVMRVGLMKGGKELKGDLWDRYRQTEKHTGNTTSYIKIIFIFTRTLLYVSPSDPDHSTSACSAPF